MSSQIPQDSFNVPEMPKEMWAMITEYDSEKGKERVTDVRRLIDLFKTSAYDPQVWEREAAYLKIDLSSKDIAPTSKTANTVSSDVSLKITESEPTKSFAGSAAATPAVTSATPPSIETTKPEVVYTSTIVSAASTTSSIASSFVVVPSSADRAADAVLRYYYEKDVFEAIMQVSPPAKLEASRLDDPLKKHDAIMEMLQLDKNRGAMANLFCRLITNQESKPDLRIRDAAVFLIKHGLINDINAPDKKVETFESSLKTVYDYIPWIIKNVKNTEDSQAIIDALIKECKGFSADEAQAKLLAMQDLTDDQKPNFYAAMHKILEIKPPGLADYENVLLNLKKCIDAKKKLNFKTENLQLQYLTIAASIQKHIQLIALLILNDPNIREHRSQIKKLRSEIEIKAVDCRSIDSSLLMCNESYEGLNGVLLEGILAYEREQNHTILEKGVLRLTDPLQIQQSIRRALVKLVLTRGAAELLKLHDILKSMIVKAAPQDETDDDTFERAVKNANISRAKLYLIDIKKILDGTQSPRQIEEYYKFMKHDELKPPDPNAPDPDDPYN